MNMRALVILAVAAILLAALAFVGQDRSAESLTDTDVAVFPELEGALNDVERIRLTKAGNEIIATLERSEGSWTVAERDGYPADVAAIRRTLLDLADARAIERKTADPEYYDRLGVEPIESETAGGTLIEIEALETEFPALIVGDPESSSYRYGRFADESESFLLDANPEVPRDTAQWLDARILDVSGSRVREVTIAHPDGETVRIYKDGPEQANFSVADVPPDRELMYAGVANATGTALADLALEDVAADDAEPNAEADADDADDAAVTAQYRTFDGLVVTARAIERDGAAWLTFEAAVDADAADAARDAGNADAAANDAATPAGATDGNAGAADGDGSATDGDGSTTAGDAGTPAGEAEVEEDVEDVRAQAEAINARVSGWRYRIASHQHEQITRRMADLLQEPDEQAEE